MIEGGIIKIYKRIVFFFFATLLIFTPILNVSAAARDCDGNAFIYCGTLNKVELKNKLNRGTGKVNQTSTKLKSFLGRFGFAMTDIPNLKEGRVTKSNQVLVGGKVVASNVYTFGRHNIAGSTKVASVSYPLYRRHPSVSFVSNSIDAYVYLNSDGSMAYAILKSCGNPVEGVGKRRQREDDRDDTGGGGGGQITRVPLTIRKFHDINHDGIMDSGELGLSDWHFRIVGPNINTEVTTDLVGQFTLTDRDQGSYTITEIGKDGWESTTGMAETRNITTNVSTQTFLFGNYQPPDIPDEPTEDVPNIPAGGGDIINPGTPTSLATSGIKENIAIGVSLVLALALLFYLTSRFYLRRVLHGGYVPTDPAKLVKELRRRTHERHEKILKAEEKAEKKIKRK